MIHKPTAIKLAQKWVDYAPKLDKLAHGGEIDAVVYEGAKEALGLAQQNFDMDSKKPNRIALNRAKELFAYVESIISARNNKI